MTRLKIMLVTLAAALGVAGVAHAQPPDRATRGYVDRYVDPDDRYDPGDRYRDRYDDRRGRYARWTKLGEVSADPRDGADVLGFARTGRVDRVELRATHDAVRIERVSVRLRDGRVVTERVRGWLRVGDVLAIDLPPGARGIQSIVIDYGDRYRRRYDRTDARLEIWAAAGRRDDRGYDRWDNWDDWDDDRYDRRPQGRPPRWY